MKTLLLRGMFVGLVAGLLAVLFAHTFGEPQVNKAIAFESQQAAAAAAEAGEPTPLLVSRDIQSTWGLGIGGVVYGVAFGGIFAVAFAIANGRISRLGVRATAGLLGIAGLIAIYIVPNIKYPANPPSIGQPDTIGKRTALYFTLILGSVLLAVAATQIGRRLAPRVGNWNAATMAVVGSIVAAYLFALLMPGINEVPNAFSATLLWRFRIAALGTQVILWSTMSLLFGFLTERSLTVIRRKLTPAPLVTR